MNFTLLNNLALLCAQKGIANAVLCPGSRSAPLTLAFLRSKKIKCWTFSDERSAAFVALGMAQQTKMPVALVCTSGSAAYNFAPAVAEAFFQQIPLIVFTADRPKEWIDQMDGQTIRQTELYGNHVKKYYELPLNDSHPDAAWYSNRIVNEAINLSINGIQGPVHINVPLREPLYPSSYETVENQSARVIEPMHSDSTLSADQINSLAKELVSYKRILIVAGQSESDPELCNVVTDFNNHYSWPLVGDILSNLHSLPFFCRHTDTFLGQLPEPTKEALRPDLVITFGKSLISKNLKLFLRNYRPKAHWHLQTAGDPTDTFQSLTKIIPIHPATFFNQLKKFLPSIHPSWKDYENSWLQQEKNSNHTITQFFQSKIDGEFKLIHQILTALPKDCNLHLANSMTVRYANHIGLSASQASVKVFSNRGTSGIDGCTSTAIGNALTSDIANIIITGDQAFFYDRNAFWHNYPIPNLFVVVLNNHGGIIFNLIDGPASLPEAEEYFITRQKLNARSLASEFGFAYLTSQNVGLKEFFTSNGNVKILEIESPQQQNKEIFEDFKKQIRKSYGT